MTPISFISVGVDDMTAYEVMQETNSDGGAGAIITIMLFAIMLVFAGTIMFFAQRYKRCPPDKIMVVYGRTEKGRASKTIHGGATLVWPLIQDYAFLPLTPITISIPLENALSKQNIRISIPSTFTVAISTEPAVMSNAANRLLGLSIVDIESMAADIILGQLRLTVASLTIEQINQDREAFLIEIQKNVDTELLKIGLYLINVNLVDITDDSMYIESIGKKAAATAVNNALVDVSNAERDGAIGSSLARREKEIQVADNNAQAVKGQKQAEADRRTFVEEQEALAIGGENTAKESIAKSNAQLEIARASAKQSAEVAKAEAESHIQRAKYEETQETLRAQEIVREEIQKQQIEISANAEAQRIRLVAQGEADGVLAKYKAEAEGIQKVLEAKATGYANLVKSAAGDPKAAATLLMVEKIESMVAAQVEAIRNLKIDKITVWDGGNSAGDGSSATSNFVSSLVQSLPPIHDVAKMAGVDLPDYLGSINENSDDS
jgi:flotillin